MNVLISGHRIQKLNLYSIDWIKTAIEIALLDLKEKNGFIQGYSGMASGVDLWFCDICYKLAINYTACIPFEEQGSTMSAEDSAHRSLLIDRASNRLLIKNSLMVEKCHYGIIVFDGNKGGTQNVFQQMIEKHKSFIWINPEWETITTCEPDH